MAGISTSHRLGASLRKQRMDLGMSQQELSEQLGVSRARISAMENGEFGSAKLLLEVAEAIGLDAFFLPRTSKTARSIRLEQEELQGTIIGTRVRRTTHG